MTDELRISVLEHFTGRSVLECLPVFDFNNDKHKPALRAEADGILFTS